MANNPETTWHQDAACLGMDTDIFFLENKHDQNQAIATCISCPVRWQCLEEDLTYHTTHGTIYRATGIYGGYHPQARINMLRAIKKEGISPHELSTKLASLDNIDPLPSNRRHTPSSSTIHTQNPPVRKTA